MANQKQNKVKDVGEIEQKTHMIRVNELKDTPIFNREGKHLGNIDDIILDIKHGKIAFGILSFGGILGLGETKYAIPWEALDYKENREIFTMDIDEEKIKGAEPFNEDEQPYLYPGWAPGLYGYYGFAPYWYV